MEEKERFVEEGEQLDLRPFRLVKQNSLHELV